ncbi:hypothetical protein [Leifsonia sp. TF02-11]|uniref:hypothetical protein n=1 Tax=Leifsonia sp. TF02-11 TaxID=2815212 RepID=UPI001AA1332B|nr:hypothetical protein [Leifsonia sp. TF02-11]MBO1741021.1 hypothetical protein [Leifsonia sp. TF02-11]
MTTVVTTFRPASSTEQERRIGERETRLATLILRGWTLTTTTSSAGNGTITIVDTLIRRTALTRKAGEPSPAVAASGLSLVATA